MADTPEFYLPGGDGKWDSSPLPTTFDEAIDRIEALEAALAFYSDARSYKPDSMDNESPTHSELMDDQGMRARIGRLATTAEEYGEWHVWALHQDRRF